MRDLVVALLACAAFCPSSRAQEDSLAKAKQEAAKMPAASGTAVPSLFYISFTQDPPQEKPDHSRLEPGPAGGPDEVYGYTDPVLDYEAAAPWKEGPARQDGLIPVYTKTVRVYYHLSQKVSITSAFPEESCPYLAVLAHERAHVQAFAAIYRVSYKPLSAALEKSQDSEPRIGTEEKPVLCRPSEVAAYKAAVKKKIEGVLQEHLRGPGGLSELWEVDRADKDSAASYLKVYDGCSAADWRKYKGLLRAALKDEPSNR